MKQHLSFISKPQDRYSSKKKQYGLSSLELMAGLTVMAVVLGGVAPIVYSMLTGADSSTAARVTQSYFTNMKAKWRDAPYTGLNTQWAIDAGVVDINDVSGSTVLNHWRRSMVFSAGTITGGIANGARQITDPVDPDSCLHYVTDMADHVDEMLVGSTTVKAYGGKLNVASATSACKVTTVSVNVIMRKA